MLTNTYRLLFYGKSVSNITQSLDCAAFWEAAVFVFSSPLVLLLSLAFLIALLLKKRATGERSALINVSVPNIDNSITVATMFISAASKNGFKRPLTLSAGITYTLMGKVAMSANVARYQTIQD